MNLLLISDPVRCGDAAMDVPAFYRAAARRPGWRVHHCPTQRVVGSDPDRLPVASLPADLSHGHFQELNQRAPAAISLKQVDLVFCRSLKPFPAGYLDALSGWERLTRFVNRPSSKRIQMRADFLPSFAAPFLIGLQTCGDAAALEAFTARHGVIVAKRMNSTGGRAVFRVWRQDGDWCTDNIVEGRHRFTGAGPLMAHLQSQPGEVLQLSRFLPRALEGDKRVVVVDGEIQGAYLRRSGTGHWVNNVSHDGQCSLAEIGAGERRAIEATVPRYRELGLFTLGYDFLRHDDGRWLISEINVGNVGGFHRLQRLSGEPVLQRLLSWMERSIQGRPPPVERSSPSAAPP